MPTEQERILLHATTIAVGELAVVLRGPSGAGKSDLALRLLAMPSCWLTGAADLRLVADDQTIVTRAGRSLWASPPEAIAGRMEVRGVGILPVPARHAAEVRLVVDLVAMDALERLPEPRTVEILGLHQPVVALTPLEASAPLKVLAALHLVTREANDTSD